MIWTCDLICDLPITGNDLMEFDGIKVNGERLNSRNNDSFIDVTTQQTQYTKHARALTELHTELAN